MLACTPRGGEHKIALTGGTYWTVTQRHATGEDDSTAQCGKIYLHDLKLSRPTYVGDI